MNKSEKENITNLVEEFNGLKECIESMVADLSDKIDEMEDLINNLECLAE